jgi:hypothetical protein
MPLFLMDQREWVKLTDEQVAYARMALDDHRDLMPQDAHVRAIRTLRDSIPITLKHAVCAVAYAEQYPHGR